MKYFAYIKTNLHYLLQDTDHARRVKNLARANRSARAG